MSDSKTLMTVADLDMLPDRERAAYEAWLAKHQPQLAPSTASKMFEAYINGSSCEDIQKLNPGMALGAIVDCKLRDDWDKRLETYRRDLLDDIGLRLRQIQLESVEHIADQLAVAHKRDGQKLKRFLMTGDEKDLGNASFITGIKSYEVAVKALLALTGQDKEKDKKGLPVPTSPPVRQMGAAGQVVEVSILDRQPTEAEAAEILEAHMPPRGRNE